MLNAVPDISQTKYKYVGVNTCTGVCHNSESQGDQYIIWKESAHSKAYKTLQTIQADSIASSKGFTSPASETPECVRCHTIGKIPDESEFQASFDITQGVQCESCHGPGSGYKSGSIMRDKDKAVKNGLILHTEKRKFCITCHNSESPTYFEFNYEPMWEMIAHSKPKESE
ncbi:MAG: cytochrome C554 [Bacteroidetes bacterium]|nr:cytochrome C554 [Bacteroidota bacterium]